MMALLDTHVFLWWITDDPRLSEQAGNIISNSENRLFFSAASGWETVRGKAFWEAQSIQRRQRMGNCD